MDLSGYLAVAKRWWWTLIVAAWIAGLTGYLVATTIQPTYEAQVKVLVGPLNTDTDTLRASGLLVQTYAQYVTDPRSPRVHDPGARPRPAARTTSRRRPGRRPMTSRGS